MPSESAAARIAELEREVEYLARGHEVEGTVPSQWWLDLKVENQRLREALTYYAEGRYPDNGETAREALGDV